MSGLSLLPRSWHPLVHSLDLSELAKAAKKKLQAVSLPHSSPPPPPPPAPLIAPPSSDPVSFSKSLTCSHSSLPSLLFSTSPPLVFDPGSALAPRALALLLTYSGISWSSLASLLPSLPPWSLADRVSSSETVGLGGIRDTSGFPHLMTPGELALLAPGASGSDKALAPLCLQLSNRLFEELAMDVYDEVDRRENDAGELGQSNYH